MKHCSPGVALYLGRGGFSASERSGGHFDAVTEVVGHYHGMFRCGEVKREETNRQKKKGDRMMPDAAFYFHFIDYP